VAIPVNLVASLPGAARDLVAGRLHSRVPSTLLIALGAAPVSPKAAALLMQLMHLSTLTICFAPVILAAIIGELAQLRSWFWYACCSGVLAAETPLDPGVWRGAADAADATSAISELRFMPLYLLVGLVAGTIYWLMAGRTDQLAPTPQEWSMK
jgi:hypothetical protein